MSGCARSRTPLQNRARHLAAPLIQLRPRAEGHRTRDCRRRRWEVNHHIAPRVVLFFQNAHLSQLAPQPRDISNFQKLPSEIDFYVTTKMDANTTFPLPSSYPAKKYLHTAETKVDYESAGPVFHLPLDPDHIVGLHWHMLKGGGLKFQPAPLAPHPPGSPAFTSIEAAAS